MGCIFLAGSLMLTRKYITEKLSFPGKYPVSEGPVNRPLPADWDLWTDASPSAGTKILRPRLRMTCPAGRKARNTAAVRRYIFIARRTIPQASGCRPRQTSEPDRPVGRSIRCPFLFTTFLHNPSIQPAAQPRPLRTAAPISYRTLSSLMLK